jgi:hypothetical protein
VVVLAAAAVAAIVAALVVIDAQGSSTSTADRPGSIRVAVLNAKSTTGLAHRLAKALQSAGYAKATALDTQPPGTYTVTLVEYKHGDRADAQAVAHDLRVTRVQTMTANLSALAGSATIAVVAGDTQANP